jgi:hypothetical protein
MCEPNVIVVAVIANMKKHIMRVANEFKTIIKPPLLILKSQQKSRYIKSINMALIIHVFLIKLLNKVKKIECILN